MPVKITVPSAEYCAANDSRFDATVRRLAPIIRQLREDPARRSTRKLTDRLNNMGQYGPNGKAITPSTMRRILQRLPELHLGDGPSNRSRAAPREPTRCYRPQGHACRYRQDQIVASDGIWTIHPLHLG